VTATVRRLERTDDRSAFRSGNIELDRFFQSYAGQNQFRHHVGTTYVAIDEARAILGFATVAASEFAVSHLPATRRKHLPGFPVPVLRLARMAVDERYTHQGVARLLLSAAFGIAHKMAADMGCVGVMVDAKTDAVSFYEKLGFIPLEALSGQLGDRPQPLPMFLELAAIPAMSSRPPQI
jgi:GNAT superfamily N-acetyltransferase